MTNNISKYLALPIFLLLGFSARCQEFVYPAIKEYGAIANLENAILPDKGGKILIDLTTAEPTKNGISKSMDRIARLINLYEFAGISSDQLEIAVIIHGPATKTILTNEAYREKFGVDNPDLPAINVLTAYGVDFMVCGQALVRRGFGVERLNPGVKLSISAITLLVDYQQKGFAVLYY